MTVITTLVLAFLLFLMFVLLVARRRGTLVENPKRGALFKLGIAWTALLQLIGAWVAGPVFSMHPFLFLFSLVAGWIPIVVVELRRRQKPVLGDIVLLVLWYPVLFATLVVVSRRCFPELVGAFR